MFVLVRAVTYAALFIALLLIFLPARLLSWSGIIRPAAIELQQVAGMVIGAVGAAIALWCILTFALIGRGTPAPFDPPRRLVIRGPYHFVRNPMYMGAGLALASAAPEHLLEQDARLDGPKEDDEFEIGNIHACRHQVYGDHDAGIRPIAELADALQRAIHAAGDLLHERIAAQTYRGKR